MYVTPPTIPVAPTAAFEHMIVTAPFPVAVTVQGDVGAKTVTATVALNDPEVAVIVAMPSAMEVTKPSAETVAVPVLDDDHITVAPETTVPLASFTVAFTVVVASVDISESVLGDTSSVAAA